MSLFRVFIGKSYHSIDLFHFSLSDLNNSVINYVNHLCNNNKVNMQSRLCHVNFQRNYQLSTVCYF
jgi:hypothetical protein